MASQMHYRLYTQGSFARSLKSGDLWVGKHHESLNCPRAVGFVLQWKYYIACMTTSLATCCDVRVSTDSRGKNTPCWAIHTTPWHVEPHQTTLKLWGSEHPYDSEGRVSLWHSTPLALYWVTGVGTFPSSHPYHDMHPPRLTWRSPRSTLLG